MYTDMDIRVHKFMNMYVHVCTTGMFRHVYTVLPYPVQARGGRIPDDDSDLNIQVL